MSTSLSREQLIAIAQQFGTPVYVYHAEKIEAQYAKLTDAFRDCKARFFYACKSLANINILKHIHALGCGLDCVSINEVKLGLKAGFRPQQILLRLTV